MRPVALRQSSVLALLAAFALAPLRELSAQDDPKGHWENVTLHSGMLANNNPVEGVVYRDFVTLPDKTPWVRVYFTGVVLPKGSYVRIASVSDGDAQVLTQADLAKANNASAYFHGNSVLVELVAGANTAKTSIEIDKVLAGDAAVAFPPAAQQVGGGANSGGAAGIDTTNDECTSAIPVFVGVNGVFSSVGSTTSFVWPCGAGGNDVWYRLTAPCTGIYTFTTCTPSRTFDTVLEVFDGAGGCGALFSLGCNDDTGGACGLGSTLTLGPLAAGTYFIRVGGFASGTGGFDLAISSTCINDECVTQFALGLGTSGPFTNIGSTTSFPWPCGAGGNDVWFSYDAPCATVTIDTCGSGYDTTLEVFGGPCGALISLGCNDDSCGLQSRVTVTVTTAQRLFFRIGGFVGATGVFIVNISQVIPNDDCTGAIGVVDGVNGPFCTDGASTSAPGWVCAGGGNDLWYSYTASCTGFVTVTTCTPARTYDTALSIYSGSCGSLNLLACNDDTGGGCGLGSTVSVPVVGSQPLLIRLGGFIGFTGHAELLITCTPNDECAVAIPVTLGVNGTYSNASATASAPPFTCGFGVINDNWYRYTATCTCPHTFTTCTANRTVDTVLRIFDACGGTLVGCNDDQGLSCTLGTPPTNFASRLTVPLNNGVTYFISIGGYNGATGNFDLAIEEGTGTGTIVTACTGCGPMTISVTGAPHIDSTINTSIGGFGAGLPFIGLGFGPFCPAPFCGTCRVGHSWSAVNFGSTNSWSIPCVPGFIGIQVGIQGAGFLTPGGCASPLISLTDTVVVTIG